jgi:hypothetical protein
MLGRDEDGMKYTFASRPVEGSAVRVADEDENFSFELRDMVAELRRVQDHPAPVDSFRDRNILNEIQQNICSMKNRCIEPCASLAFAVIHVMSASMEVARSNYTAVLQVIKISIWILRVGSPPDTVFGRLQTVHGRLPPSAQEAKSPKPLRACLGRPLQVDHQHHVLLGGLRLCARARARRARGCVLVD